MVLKRRNYMWRDRHGPTAGVRLRGPTWRTPPARTEADSATITVSVSRSMRFFRNAANSPKRSPHHAAMSIRLRHRSPAAAVMASNCSSVIIGRSTDSSRPALRMEHRRSDRATSPARRCSANSADWTRLGFIAQRSDRGLRPGGLALRALPHSGARGPTVRYLRVGSAMMC